MLRLGVCGGYSLVDILFVGDVSNNVRWSKQSLRIHIWYFETYRQ